MNLTEAEIRRLKDAAFLHDIGKVVIAESIANKKECIDKIKPPAVK